MEAMKVFKQNAIKLTREQEMTKLLPCTCMREQGLCVKCWCRTSAVENDK